MSEVLREQDDKLRQKIEKRMETGAKKRGIKINRREEDDRRREVVKIGT
jgi:hypothetical protein